MYIECVSSHESFLLYCVITCSSVPKTTATTITIYVRECLRDLNYTHHGSFSRFPSGNIKVNGLCLIIHAVAAVKISANNYLFHHSNTLPTTNPLHYIKKKVGFQNVNDVRCHGYDG